MADYFVFTSSEFTLELYHRDTKRFVLTDILGISEESKDGFGCDRTVHYDGSRTLFC